MIKSVNNSLRGKNIYVGLSGGVDSAVTAALLQEAGAHVTGVFIKGWYPPGMPCTWANDRRDAMRVAAHLRIPFVTLDASKEYKESVIDYLLDEYKAGRTPNGDIMCNRDVKFGVFYRYAKECGADLIATGHYAQIQHGRLLRGIDASKDQSYFLWAVPREILADVIFPLGEMEKTDTRMLAKKYKLPNAIKRDSQGICFLGNVSVEDFLRKEIGTTVGKALDEEGKMIGSHGGAVLYTLGERIALEGATPGPWYVLAKDMKNNTLTVSREKNKRAHVPETLRLTSCNWLSPNLLEGNSVIAQYRYHGPNVPGILSTDTNTWIPNEVSEDIPAPGQSLVLYVNDECIGGGIIE